MLALVLVAVAVGFSNLAASIGVGAGGVDHRTRLQVVVIFGLLEAGMPIVGLLIGHGLASEAGRDTRWLAAGLLVAVGGYGMVSVVHAGRLPGIGSRRHGSVRDDPPEVRLARSDGSSARRGAGSARGEGGSPRTGYRRKSVKLLATGFALSLDNLVAGFALGAYQVSIIAGAAVFGVVSTVMSLAGLEFGALLGQRAGGRGELIGGAVLIGVGVAIGAGALG